MDKPFWVAETEEEEKAKIKRKVEEVFKAKPYTKIKTLEVFTSGYTNYRVKVIFDYLPNLQMQDINQLECVDWEIAQTTDNKILVELWY